MPVKSPLLNRIRNNPENISAFLPELVILSTQERAALLDKMRKIKLPIDALQQLFSENPSEDCPPADQLQWLKWLGIHNRAALFEPDNLTTLATLYRKDQPAFEAIMDYWRACKVHDRNTISKAVQARARELPSEAMPHGAPVVVITPKDGALPVVNSIAAAIKRTMPDVLFIQNGQLVYRDDSAFVPVTPHWLGMTMEDAGVVFMVEWKTLSKPERAYPPLELLQMFISVAKRYGFPDISA
jgi:hypothetical protein